MPSALKNAVEPAPRRYRVLRALKVSNDETAQPGDVITAGSDWPYHRARDLTAQRYLEPLSPSGEPRKEPHRGQ